jgi:hypothetical protein
MKPLIYLASPHSHTEPLVRQMRYELALKALRILLKNGLHVFSPIVHSHNLNLDEPLEFWLEFDFHILEKCDELWILDIDGTNESKGVQAEVERWHGQHKICCLVEFMKNEIGVTVTTPDLVSTPYYA